MVAPPSDPTVDQMPNALGPTRAAAKSGNDFLMHTPRIKRPTLSSQKHFPSLSGSKARLQRAKCCGSEIPISADEWLFVPQRYHCCLDYRPSIYSLLKSPEVRRYQGRTGYVLPRTGCVLPRTGYALPRTVYVLPRTGYALPRTGHVLPRTGYVLHQSISHSVKRGSATRTESMGGRTIGRSQFSQNGRRHSSL